jgi:DNA-3-methyladenine glycosylase II
MFAMFSLRRPDILPVGDLGVQRGLLQWVLSSHLPDQYPLRLSPKKLPKTDDAEAETGGGTVNAGETQTTVGASPGDSSSVLPAPAVPTTPRKSQLEPEPSSGTGAPLPTKPATTAPKTPPRKPLTKKSAKGKEKEQAVTRTVPLRPTSAVPLPDGITLDMLKSRASGKKVKGGCYLLPGEMHALTQAWAPYRSLGKYCSSVLDG